MPYPLVASQGTPYGPLVTFKTQGILPPSAVYVGPSDALQWEIEAPGIIVNCSLTVRILTPQGEVKELTQTTLVSVIAPDFGTVVFAPNECFLLSAHARCEAFSRGQVFMRLFLRKNPAASDLTLGQLLFQGYVSQIDHIGYPQSETESCLSGKGWSHLVLFATGTLGTGAQITVPPKRRWAIRTIVFTVVTNTGVGPRAPMVTILSQAVNVIAQIVTPASIAASSAVVATFGETLPFSPINFNRTTAPLPTDLLLFNGDLIEASAAGLQSDDLIQNPVAMEVEEWIE